MKTRSADTGKLISPARLLEVLEFRFGAFTVIAHAALALSETELDLSPVMDRRTALAILEFGYDLAQAYEASSEWLDEHGLGDPPDPNKDSRRPYAAPAVDGATTLER